MDRATLLRIICDKPELTDYVATYVIKYRLPYWEDAREAQEEFEDDEDPVESGYWEDMLEVLRGDPVAEDDYDPISPHEYYTPCNM